MNFLKFSLTNTFSSNFIASSVSLKIRKIYIDGLWNFMTKIMRLYMEIRDSIRFYPIIFKSINESTNAIDEI